LTPVPFQRVAAPPCPPLAAFASLHDDFSGFFRMASYSQILEELSLLLAINGVKCCFPAGFPRITVYVVFTHRFDSLSSKKKLMFLVPPLSFLQARLLPPVRGGFPSLAYLLSSPPPPRPPDTSLLSPPVPFVGRQCRVVASPLLPVESPFLFFGFSLFFFWLYLFPYKHSCGLSWWFFHTRPPDNVSFSKPHLALRTGPRRECARPPHSPARISWLPWM